MGPALGTIVVCATGWALAAALVLGPATPGHAEAPAGQDLQLFTISKSENKNLVQYVVRVDPACAPASPTPVSAYWRLLESHPPTTAPLLGRELPAYGLASQAVASRSDEGGTVRITLRALPTRTLTVETFRGAGGHCEARALTSIHGETARLFDVYVRLRFPFHVEYLLLQGWSADGTHIVSERIEPS